MLAAAVVAVAALSVNAIIWSLDFLLHEVLFTLNHTQRETTKGTFFPFEWKFVAILAVVFHLRQNMLRGVKCERPSS